ncbi:hypothetical protein [Prochlorococcus marinus]|uniref:Uncharacterized protein n=1 Tax=Prochlorococcus marinus XMU1408 TaxID=2213228 RepID=A0A318RCG9_PROMR|nr:hypothetical protein [Prochlorococcus marinus]MBW3041105.1 hypothetical protein [Prochlorococcus marinus str. XMU1408]PYE03708.1 hypothetical protein DNJ73_00530 [Prochlorococcus marinus XMU1408]
MLRANFFYRFFKYKPAISNEIVKYTSDKRFDLQSQINNKIIEIDQRILENSNALLEAQSVKFRSAFSKSNNFIEKIGRNIYQTKLEDSIDWYQQQLKELYFKRRKLQVRFEKIKGVYWLNQIKRFLTIIFSMFLILLSLLIFLSGFMIIIYLLPLIIVIFLVYFISAKR